MPMPTPADLLMMDARRAADLLMMDARRALEGRDWYWFNELSDKAQAKAVDHYVGDWSDIELDTSPYSDALRQLGVMDVEIAWSGFASQGDGASFTGAYRHDYARGGKGPACAARVWPELRPLCRQLLLLQRRFRGKLCAYIVRGSHRYQHEYTVNVNAYLYDDPNADVPVDAAVELTEIMRELMKWVYRSLKNEWEYQTDDGARDCLQEAGCRFCENGTLHD